MNLRSKHHCSCLGYHGYSLLQNGCQKRTKVVQYNWSVFCVEKCYFEILMSWIRLKSSIFSTWHWLLKLCSSSFIGKFQNSYRDIFSRHLHHKCTRDLFNMCVLSSYLHYLFFLSPASSCSSSSHTPLHAGISRGFGSVDRMWLSTERETKGGHESTSESGWKFPCCFDQPFVCRAIHLQQERTERSVSTEWLMLQNAVLMWPGMEPEGHFENI